MPTLNEDVKETKSKMKESKCHSNINIEHGVDYWSIMWRLSDSAQVYPEYLITYKQLILSDDHKAREQSPCPSIKDTYSENSYEESDIEPEIIERSDGENDENPEEKKE